ncbi:hypothetical protein X777_05511 [Ooceraea biroi]|uniref:Uncharacterized protein n=1 Tax=Ooceraea biroi TaxID=2015173 RepID=A0A026WEN6_OOCBI|nr:hypothetical protein X777_05511 [Ooceraea biroi]
MHRILSLARIPRDFSCSCSPSPPPPPPPPSRTASSHFCFPTFLVECVASALTHCQKERGLRQWLACVHEEAEEEGTDEGEEEEENEDDEGEEDGEEETITIEGVRPPGRRCYSSIFSTFLIFLLTFCPLVSDRSSPRAFFARDAPVARAKITGDSRRRCRGRKEELEPIHGLFTGLLDRKIN